MCEVTLTGTHLGDFPLIPPLHGATLAPNGREFTVKHIHGFRLKEAKIVEHFAVRDDLACSSSLGISARSPNSPVRGLMGMPHLLVKILFFGYRSRVPEQVVAKSAVFT